MDCEKKTLTLDKKPNMTAKEEVKTLFVSGLPNDVKEREMHILFRTYQGYEGTFLKLFAKPGKIPQPIAFVSFSTRKEAEKAIAELQGLRMDPNLSLTLRLEFAHTNSRTSPQQASCSCSAHLSNRNSHQYYFIPPSAYYTPKHPNYTFLTPNHWQNLFMAHTGATTSPSYFPNHPTVITSCPTITATSDGHQNTLWQTISKDTQTNGDICNTLFVANLEPYQTEKELRKLFMLCHGFVRTKMYTKSGPPVCFVEFLDVESASTAMERFQGFMSQDSRRGSGLRIEFAKQRMGESSQTDTQSDTTSPFSTESRSGFDTSSGEENTSPPNLSLTTK